MIRRAVPARTYDQIRTASLIGSLFTLALAGVSPLVLALEQVRERRRPLGMLSGAGVPRAVLPGWSGDSSWRSGRAVLAAGQGVSLVLG